MWLVRDVTLFTLRVWENTSVFGRSKDSAVATSEPTSEVSEVLATGETAKKGRPTPKRKEAEAALRRPLVPEDRKSAKKEARSQAREERARVRAAQLAGDESALPPKDRGPVKAYIRDIVDSRLNVGELILPLMLVVLVLTFLPVRALQFGGLLVVWLILVAGAIDSALLWRRVKRKVLAKFGTPPPKGSAFYTIMRSFQMRMSRIPRPRVKRGAAID